jgi:hypothetical protein
MIEVLTTRMARSPHLLQASGGCFLSTASSSALTRASRVATRLNIAHACPKMRLTHATALATKWVSTGEGMADQDAPASFSHAKTGMTRFPPNVEQISVEHESVCTWLVVRRNELTIRLPLSEADRHHLASLLIGEGPSQPQPST